MARVDEWQLTRNGRFRLQDARESQQRSGRDGQGLGQPRKNRCAALPSLETGLSRLRTASLDGNQCGGFSSRGPPSLPSQTPQTPGRPLRSCRTSTSIAPPTLLRSIHRRSTAPVSSELPPAELSQTPRSP